MIKCRKLLGSILWLVPTLLITSLMGLSACGGGSGGGSSATSATGVVVTGTLDSQSLQVAKTQGIFERFFAMVFPRSADASVQTVTSIIARSTDGSTTETATISGSNFSITLPAGKTYLIFLLDGTTTVGTLTVDPTSGMAVIPVSTSSKSFSLGTVSLSGSTATPTLSESQILSSLGIDSTTAATLATYSQTVTWLDNGDVDGDGILDYKENRLYKFIIQYWLGPGYSGNYSTTPGATFAAAESGYVTPPIVNSSTPHGYSFEIAEAGTTLSTMPTYDTTGLNDTGCNPTPNIVLDAPSNVTAYGSSTTTLEICSYNGNFQANGVSLTLNGQTLSGEGYQAGGGGGNLFLSPVTPPSGTYKLTGSSTSNCGANGCTLTFDNVNSLSMTNLTNIFYPSIQLTMSGSLVTGFSWKWYEYDSSSGSWIQPSTAVLQSVLTLAIAEFGDVCDGNKVDVSIGITPTGTASVPAANQGQTDSNCIGNMTGNEVRLSLVYGDIGGYTYMWGDY